MDINDEVWERLRSAAREASERAYAPYSGYSVGAAALAEDGNIYTGCNVENASTGVGLCAECGLVSQAVRSGAGKLVAFTCVNGSGETISPCGRCRQLLREFGGRELVLLMPSGVMTMDEVLPDSFGPDSMVGHTMEQPFEFAEGESRG
ncbi:MAG: cytidine deaminase [Actinomycetaceae bacterium]|nr:cytidine deaminase [Actinomycetaceae bacterium]